MQQPDLTRRQVLSGIAVTGGAGAFTGRGTATIFTDEETFTDNSVTASASTAGVVALDVSIDSLDNADGLIYTIEVPDLTNNNPSYVWVQPATCPDPLNQAGNVNVELRLKRDDGDDVEISTGTLKKVVNDLRKDAGESLSYSGDSADARCFEPGESVDLVLEVTDSSADAAISFDLEFYAEQCRYNTGTGTPFEELDACETGQTTTPGKGISFIAFCSESDVTLDPEIVEIIERNDDGDPVSLEWQTHAGVRYVVVKSGRNFTLYNYSDGSIKNDTVTTGGNDDALYTSEPSQSRSSEPCELAAEEFGTDSSEIQTSVKLDESEFVAEGGSSEENLDPAGVTHSR
ncbi:hypothetical protein EKH57_13545 [Halorubrum sp. BOL3-1]|uniref:hypothetical protein n=1 Tax=Halorubrum sp. BOL3-1 TaxID=2497325 RepID=UPI001005228C|nr:hypothetical protein [Halorubrum sp. BOL3-1]QAU13658.1 hypothetical protein EKH57_13545 [Halorubrum sp. BOL3-1]